MNASYSIMASFLAWAPLANAVQPSNIHITRQRMVKIAGQPRGSDLLISGSISINNKIVGKTYENFAKRIPPGRYAGILRHHSTKNFVQNSSGVLTHDGDFLVEVAGVPGRTGIVFHAGDQPKQSKGCILLGPVTKNPLTGARKLSPDHPLRIMRALFYRTQSADMAFQRQIKIMITDKLDYRKLTASEANKDCPAFR